MPGPPGRPLVGNLAEIWKPNFHKIMTRWAALYGEVYRISILGLDGAWLCRLILMLVWGWCQAWGLFSDPALSRRRVPCKSAGVVVASPEAVSAVLGLGGKMGSEVPKHAQSYWSLDLLWGDGDTHTVITGLSTDTWKAVHKAVAPCFNTLAVRRGPKSPVCIQFANS